MRLKTIFWTVSVAVSLMSAARADQTAQIEEPGRAASSQQDEDGRAVTLYLELVVNGLQTGKVVPVQHKGGTYRIQAGDLAESSIKIEGSPDRMIDLSTMKEVKLEYESVTQQLLLTVPPDWLPAQTVGGRRVYERTSAAVDLGFLFNYDVYTSAPTGVEGFTSAWTEARLFDTWGAIVNTGVYRQPHGGSGLDEGNRGYLRYDTSWSYADLDRMLTYTAGDLITGALSWSNAVRLGGVSVAKDFSMRPDIVTYPLPQFAGQASVPTAVDLFINGSRISTGLVNPGPFTISSVPFISGAGEATVVTTNALGQQVATTVPFYVANTLLREDLFTYSLSGGAIRRNYGIESFSYGESAASATARYGLTNGVTIEGHAEGGREFRLGGVGSSMGLGMYGVFNVAATQSSMRSKSGRQYGYGYSYASQKFSVALQRLQRTDGYQDLSVYDLPADVNYEMSRASTQATAAFNLGQRFGSLGIGYFDIRAADNNRTKIANLSYTRRLYKNASLYIAVNRTIGSNGVSAQAQVMIPFGSEGAVNVGMARNNDGKWSEQVQYGRAVPSDGGFGWNLAYAGGNSHYKQADMTWRNPYFQVQAGVYGAGEEQGYTRWGEMQGSVAVMDGVIMMANRVPDAFAMIDTDGIKDVPVLYENRIIGKTNDSGHLLVPWAPSYYAAKYEIDPLGLPGNVNIQTVDQLVAIRRQAGALVKFPIARVVSANIKLVDVSGGPLKAGLRVTHQESGQASVVGWDGQTYFEGLSAENHLIVSLSDGGRCAAKFSVNVQVEKMQHVGPVLCGN